MRIMELIEKNSVIVIIAICVIVFSLFFGKIYGSNENADEIPLDTESRIEEFLMKLKGVGECEVVIYMEKERSSGFSSSENETICGIAVICEGGSDVFVKETVTDVLMRLYGISGSRISVNAMS